MKMYYKLGVGGAELEAGVIHDTDVFVQGETQTNEFVYDLIVFDFVELRIFQGIIKGEAGANILNFQVDL